MSLRSVLVLLALGLLAGCSATAGLATDPAPAPPPPVVQHGGPPLVGFWGLNGRIHPAALRDVRSRLGADLFHSATVDPAFARACIGWGTRFTAVVLDIGLMLQGARALSAAYRAE